jgi:uncharacterized protein (TIGR03435 family)
MIPDDAIPALANHLWESTAVAALIGVLVLALRGNSARVRHWLWMAASVKFLVPIALLIMAGNAMRPAVPERARPSISRVLAQVTQPFRWTVAIRAVSNEKGSTDHEKPPAAAARRIGGWRIAQLVWIAGFGSVLFSWWRKWRRVRRSLAGAQEVGSIQGIPVLSSQSLLEPGAFGVFRPVIVVPDGIREKLTGDQLSAVLSHELAHVRRRDNLAAALHMFVEALFWFHPLAWWIGARLVEERERACDEAVLQSGNAAEAYAQGILNVCKLYLESPLACVPGVTGADLKKRIVRIVTQQGTRPLDLGRKVLLAAAGIFAVLGPVSFGLLHVVQLQAQASAAHDLAGTWQGTLHAGKDLRTVLKVRKEDAVYKADMYSIDQGGRPMPVTSISQDGTTVKFSIMFLDGSYEGKMSPDGNTISGSWTQGGKPIPLELKRASADTEWPIPEAAPRPKPMAADAKPLFDVSTIKPSKPDEPGKLFGFDGQRFKTVNTTLDDLIGFAYGVQPKQIVNAQPWLSSDKFDILAQPDMPGMPNPQQLKGMLQKLLTDRFKLTFHHEQKELSVYALELAKDGPKFKKSPDQGGMPGLFFRGLGVLPVQNATMEEFAGVLQSAVLDRPVVDRTGLQGKYDFILKWTPDESQFAGVGIKVPPPSNAPDAPPNLFAAVQEELGLKLDATKAAVDVMAIDHVEKPSEN